MHFVEHTISPSGAVRLRAFVESGAIAPRNVEVWLPPHARAADRRLPVIYMHDGQNLFEAGFSAIGEPWRIDAALERVMAERGIPGAIIVAVWNNSPLRRREYGPQQALESLRGTPAWATYLEFAGGPPIADAYLRFLVDELKPQIDAQFPTLPDQAHTAIMGSSMGGLVSLYALEQYPHIFGAAGCLSTHWPAAGEALVDAMGAALPPPGDHRLYFDYGTETLDAAYEPLQRRMDNLLAAAGYRHGVDWISRKFPGAEHSERSWQERAHIPLAFLLGYN